MTSNNTFTNQVSIKDIPGNFSVTVTSPYNVGDTIDQLAHEVIGQTFLEDAGHRVRAMVKKRLEEIADAQKEGKPGPAMITQEEVDAFCSTYKLSSGGGRRKDPLTKEIETLASVAARTRLERAGIKPVAENLKPVVEAMLANPETYAKLEAMARKRMKEVADKAAALADITL